MAIENLDNKHVVAERVMNLAYDIGDLLHDKHATFGDGLRAIQLVLAKSYKKMGIDKERAMRDLSAVFDIYEDEHNKKRPDGN